MFGRINKSVEENFFKKKIDFKSVGEIFLEKIEFREFVVREIFH